MPCNFCSTKRKTVAGRTRSLLTSCPVLTCGSILGACSSFGMPCNFCSGSSASLFVAAAAFASAFSQKVRCLCKPEFSFLRSRPGLNLKRGAGRRGKTVSGPKTPGSLDDPSLAAPPPLPAADQAYGRRAKSSSTANGSGRHGPGPRAGPPSPPQRRSGSPAGLQVDVRGRPGRSKVVPRSPEDLPQTTKTIEKTGSTSRPCC